MPVDFTSDIFDALDIQDELQTLYTSGTVFHAFLGQKLEGWEVAANLVRKIAENYKLPYYTMSPTYSVCSEHGYIPGEHWTCPECGKKAEVYSRITGYYRPVQNWNDGKMAEFRERKTYDIATSVLKRGNNSDECEACKINMDGEGDSSQEIKNDGILIFTTKTCPNCKMAKMMLDKAGISYTAIDAEDNKDMTVNYGVKKAPTMLVPNGNGYDVYDNASKIKGYIESVK